MRKYYLIENRMGNISVYSEYGRPILHIFDNKKARQKFFDEYECKDINHNVRFIDAKTAKDAYYDKRLDCWSNGVIEHFGNSKAIYWDGELRDAEIYL